MKGGPRSRKYIYKAGEETAPEKTPVRKRARRAVRKRGPGKSGMGRTVG